MRLQGQASVFLKFHHKVCSGSKSRMCNRWKDMHVSKKDHEIKLLSHGKRNLRRPSFIMKTLLIKKIGIQGLHVGKA